MSHSGSQSANANCLLDQHLDLVAHAVLTVHAQHANIAVADNGQDAVCQQVGTCGKGLHASRHRFVAGLDLLSRRHELGEPAPVMPLPRQLDHIANDMSYCEEVQLQPLGRVKLRVDDGGSRSGVHGCHGAGVVTAPLAASGRATATASVGMVVVVLWTSRGVRPAGLRRYWRWMRRRRWSRSACGEYLFL